jgi:very-short-patch-repair endonuclease
VNKDLLLIDIAMRQHHLITRADVATSGLSSQQWCDRLDDGTWLPEAEGVFRHKATPPTWELRVRAAARSLGREAALYGPAAARWWGLDGFDDDRIDFVVPRIRRSLDPAVRLHTTKQWEGKDLLFHDGVRVTSATRTVIDLAASESPRALESAIDSAIRLRLTSTPTLSRRLAELAPGRRGVLLLREILLDSGGESFLERRFLRLVRHAGLLLPRCQVTYTANGRAIRVDFEFTDVDVVVEVSGRLGHTSDRDRQKDARRRNALQQRGKTVLEFTTVDVLSSPDYVLATLHTSGVVTGRPSPRRSRRDNPVGFGGPGRERGAHHEDE